MTMMIQMNFLYERKSRKNKKNCIFFLFRCNKINFASSYIKEVYSSYFINIKSKN